MRPIIIRQSVGIDVAKDDIKVCYGYVNTNMEHHMVSESSFKIHLKCVCPHFANGVLNPDLSLGIKLGQKAN
ncbi:MAG: hypothetical protein AAGF85_20245 [Bacteroidota bacterium]